jgi:hypothetical protein
MRPEPYDVIGFCELRLGHAGEGVAAMEKAVRRDPNNWDYHQALAIAQAGAGLDPRPEARKALRLNPLSPLTIDVMRRFRQKNRARWKRQAQVLVAAAFD